MPQWQYPARAPVRLIDLRVASHTNGELSVRRAKLGDLIEALEAEEVANELLRLLQDNGVLVEEWFCQYTEIHGGRCSPRNRGSLPDPHDQCRMRLVGELPTGPQGK